MYKMTPELVKNQADQGNFNENTDKTIFEGVFEFYPLGFGIVFFECPVIKELNHPYRQA